MTEFRYAPIPEDAGAYLDHLAAVLGSLRNYLLDAMTDLEGIVAGMLDGSKPGDPHYDTLCQLADKFEVILASLREE